MARFETWLKADLSQMPRMTRFPGHTFSADAGGNRIGAQVTDHGQAVTLSGTVKASVILPDGSTITVNGSRSSNRAYIDLPSSAYATAGHIEIFIKLYDGDDVTTLAACYGTVVRTQTS